MKMPLPERAKDVAAPYYLPILEPPYYYYLSKKADRAHVSPEEDMEPKRGAPDHILLVVIDALRPDHEPDLGLEFSTAISPATWTVPAVTSIHTGEYPHEHGAVTHRSEATFPPQATDIDTLPEFLESHGYKTHSCCSFFNPHFALKGWYQTHRVYSDAAAETVISHYRKWRGDRDRTFSYLHLGDLHEVISPPEEYIERHEVDTSLEELGTTQKYQKDYDKSDPQCTYYREHKIRLYRAALEYIEDQLEELLTEYPDTVAIITGDHGEAFWEFPEIDRQFSDPGPHCCLGHAGTPFDTVARVPIGTRGIDISSSIGGWRSLCDIPTTIAAEVANKSPFGEVPWQDPIEEDRIVFCESSRRGVERKAAYLNEEKVIRSEQDDVTITLRVSDTGESMEDIDRETEIRLVKSLPDDWGERDGNFLAEEGGLGNIVDQRLESLGYK